MAAARWPASRPIPKPIPKFVRELPEPTRDAGSRGVSGKMQFGAGSLPSLSRRRLSQHPDISQTTCGGRSSRTVGSCEQQQGGADDQSPP